MSRDYGQGIAHLKEEMIKKLEENSHKPDWLELTEKEISSILFEEYLELVRARTDRLVGLATRDDVMREAADLANVCMMIIDRIKRGI